ncbi:hypothetical protein DPMN_005189 [Dreissena polymorpha]|uniref:Uncharacterized protein n=1 Tax=Dreissena polymorpha TaxID=45954 RepID=A0A9D4RW94_DREPO|nr:hypothetical protein DPMN_005189 [Dreissena polymorpha]
MRPAKKNKRSATTTSCSCCEQRDKVITLHTRRPSYTNTPGCSITRKGDIWSIQCPQQQHSPGW